MCCCKGAATIAPSIAPAFGPSIAIAEAPRSELATSATLITPETDWSWLWWLAAAIVVLGGTRKRGRR